LKCDAELFQVVEALRSSRCLPGLLNGRQQQGDENANDGDRDEQLDKRKTV